MRADATNDVPMFAMEVLLNVESDPGSNKQPEIRNIELNVKYDKCPTEIWGTDDENVISENVRAPETEVVSNKLSSMTEASRKDILRE